MKIEGVVTAMISEYPFKHRELQKQEIFPAKSLRASARSLHIVRISGNREPQTFWRQPDFNISVYILTQLITYVAGSSTLLILVTGSN